MSEQSSRHIIEEAVIVRQEGIAEGIYSMWIKTAAAGEAKAGQFVSLYSSDGATLLPRPISICEINEEKTALRLVYRVVGKGTKEFSGKKSDASLRLLGPLGNGYSIREGSAMLIAGGIGIPPLVELAKQLYRQTGEKSTIVLGYRDRYLFLTEELKQYGKLFIATEDGSVGTKGNVIDAISQNGLSAKTIYACGPMPMLSAVKQFAEERKIEAQISLEERMACGVGACLGCICKTTKKDAHTHVNNARICTDGPVFNAEDVQI